MRKYICAWEGCVCVLLSAQKRKLYLVLLKQWWTSMGFLFCFLNWVFELCLIYTKLKWKEKKKKLLFLHFTIKCFILKYRDIKTWVCLWLYASFQALELVIILCMTVLRFLREIGVQIYWSVSNDWFIGLIVPQRISPGIHLHLGASVKEADSWKNSDPRK